MINKDTAVIILLIVIVFVLFFRSEYNEEGMINIAPINNPEWSRNKCDYYMNKTHTNVLSKNKIGKNENNWDFYFPCAYDQINKEIKSMPIKSEGKYFIIDNADQITAKNLLWDNIVSHHGLDRAKLISPETFVLSRQSDIDRLKNTHYSGKIYILKRNVQRQEGLKITDNLSEITVEKGKYVLAQELLQDPYTIGGRKINLRVYVLIVCQGENMDVYVYNNGFMYYTKDEFKKGSKEDGPNITTGYVERWVYKVNPLTHKDFKAYLDDTSRKLIFPVEKVLREQGLLISDVIFSRINRLIADIFISFKGKVCRPGNKLCENVTYQLFGADVAINDTLQPTIMEVNKGPDLSPKDERDGTVKYNMVQDVYKILGALPNPNNDFMKVLDIEKNKVSYY